MASDVALTGNVNDLPDDFFGEPVADPEPPAQPAEPLAPPGSGSVNDLPDDFFEPVETSNEVLYRQDNDSLLSAPQGLQAEEVEFLDDTQNNGVIPDQFFGFNKVFDRALDVALIPIQGLSATAVDIGGTLEAGSRLKIADAIRQGLKYDVDALYKKRASGEALTSEESRILMRDMSERNNIFSFLFKSPEDAARDLARDARDSGDDELVANLEQRANLLEESVQSIRQTTERIIQENFARPSEEDSTLAERFLYDVSGVGTTIAASIGLAALTKNPLASAALFSEIQEDSIYLEARDAGIGPEKARAKAELAGRVEGALEFVGVQYFFKIAEKSKGLWSVFGRMAEEAIQEFSQQFAEETITQTSGIREVDIPGGAQRVMYSMLLGFIGGGAGVGIQRLTELGKQTNEEQELGLSDAFIEQSAQKVVDNSAELIDTLSKDIEKDNSPLKQNDDAAGRVAKIMQDFQEGRPVDVANLSEKELKFLEQAREESKVIQGLREIDAQQGTNFLPVPAKPETLSRFLKRMGGLKIDTGEAQRFTRKESPNLEGVANRNGTLSIDEARALAVEAGFIKDTDFEGGVAITSEQDLLDALEQEATGIDIVRQSDLSALLERDQIIQFNEDQDQANTELLDNAGRVNTFKQAFKKGVRAAREDVKSVQDSLIGAIEQSGLSGNDRAKFIRQIKNIQTVDQLQRAAPKLERRIVNLLEADSRRTIKARIKKLLKATKPSGTTGKPIGKFGSAEVQSFLNRMRDISKMTVKEAEEALVKNVDRISIMDGFPPQEIALENSLLAIMADTPSTPVSEMQRTLSELSQIASTGRSDLLNQQLTRRAEMQEIRDALTDSVTGGRDVKQIQNEGLLKDTIKRGLNAIRTFENAVSNGWYDTLDTIFGRTEQGRQARDLLSRNVHRAIQNEKGKNIEYSRRFIELAQETYGLTKRQVGNKFLQDSKKEKLKDATGRVYQFAREGEKKAYPWKISRAEARKLWMEFQDETLVDTLISEDGNGITPEMRTVLFEEFLTPEDIQFARGQLEIYKEIYPDVDKIYSDIYGVHLPENENYSPIRRRHTTQIGDADQFLTELKERVSTTPSFAKSRIATNAEILPQSDVDAMMRHISQAAHFTSMAETARDLQSIFADNNVREALETTWGKGSLEIIDGYIQDFTAGSIKRSEGFWKWIDSFNSNMAVSALALKPNLYAKQMTSFIAYASDIPTVHFVSGVADFAKNPVKAVKILSSSPLMQARGANQDVEIAKGATRFGSSETPHILKRLKSGKARTDDVLLLSVKLGDRGAIYLGGWSVYKYNREVLGKSHEEALAAFEETTARTQQSSDLDQLSRLQANRNPVARTFTMFMTAPNAYYRASKRAIRQGFRREIGVAEMTKRLMIYNAFLPMLFQYASNAFEWDEDDQRIALQTGFLDGLFIVGPLWEQAIAALNDVYYFSGSPNFLSGFEELKDASVKSIKNGELELQDLLEAIGTITGTPVAQGFNISEGIEDIQSGDEEVGIKRVLGYTENQAGGGTGGGRNKSAF